MPSAILAHRIAHSISRDLEAAIACYEVYALSGLNKDLINRVNKGSINPGFNVISDNLHRSLIITLCRIWDKSSGVASITVLRRKLMKKQFLEKLEESTRPIDRDRIQAWSVEVDHVQRSDELKALVAARNLWLAHTQSPDRAYQGNARQAVYGDERRIIELSIPLVEEVNDLIEYAFFPFLNLRSSWKIEAQKFWDKVLPDSA
jgi:hypothetical protein